MILNRDSRLREDFQKKCKVIKILFIITIQKFISVLSTSIVSLCYGYIPRDDHNVVSLTWMSHKEGPRVQDLSPSVHIYLQFLLHA